MTRRACHAITKAGGRCKAAPIKGTNYCIAHNEIEREKTGFGDTKGRAGRPPKPRAVDILRQRVEADIDKWLAPFEDAVANAVLVTEYKGEAVVTDIPDLGARMRAAGEVLDRVYGRPKQATEVTGADGAPLMPAHIAHDPAARALIDQLRDRLAADQ